LAVAAEAEAGIVDLNRGDDGRPRPVGFPLGDFCAGMAAYAGIMTALLHRDRDGHGSHVDISMVRALLSYNSAAAAAMVIAPGHEAPTTAPYGFFPSKDGHVAIAVNYDDLWQRFLEAIERTDLADDERFRRHRERDVRVEEVNAIVEAWTRPRLSDEIVDTLARAGVPCGRVSSAGEVMAAADPARALVTEIDDGIGGTLRVPANPFGIETPGRALPRLGQHTFAVLEEVAGLDPDEVRRLADAGAVGTTVRRDR
jgi:crotonobetainyl-CoA:carnitine CoA-transferase CaiB-like acyl-CoA transferase